MFLGLQMLPTQQKQTNKAISVCCFYLYVFWVGSINKVLSVRRLAWLSYSWPPFSFPFLEIYCRWRTGESYGHTGFYWEGDGREAIWYGTSNDIFFGN